MSIEAIFLIALLVIVVLFLSKRPKKSITTRTNQNKESIVNNVIEKNLEVIKLKSDQIKNLKILKIDFK